MQRSASWLTPATQLQQAIKKSSWKLPAFAPGETFVDIPKCLLLPSEKKDWVAPFEEEKLSSMKPMTTAES